MVMFVAGGNAGQTVRPAVWPHHYLQNNGSIYNVMYTYSHENWMITPYYQYSHVPSRARRWESQTVGLPAAARFCSTTISSMEYRWPSGPSISIAVAGLNLLGYGTGSSAFAFTVTPTWQKGGFFLRGDLAVVDARKHYCGRRLCLWSLGHRWNANSGRDRSRVYVLRLPNQ